MKYLKFYKLFESNSTEVEVRDILKEIEDAGHRLDIKVHTFPQSPEKNENLHVYINFLNKYGNPVNSTVGEYSDLFKHLISYLDSEGWQLTSAWVISDKKLGEDDSVVFFKNGIDRLDLDDSKAPAKRIEFRFECFK